MKEKLFEQIVKLDNLKQQFYLKNCLADAYYVDCCLNNYINKLNSIYDKEDEIIKFWENRI